MAQPLEAMSRLAADLLVSGSGPAGVHRLPTRFVPRSSCGCAGFAERRADLAHGDERRLLDDLVERLHATIAMPYRPAGRDARIGVSIGAAQCRPGRTVDEVRHEADTAMYQVKARVTTSSG